MADKYVEDKFRNRLSNYEEDPGDDSWAFIESELPSQSGGWFLWRRITVATFVALIIGLTTFLLLPGDEDGEPKLEQEVAVIQEYSSEENEKEQPRRIIDNPGRYHSIPEPGVADETANISSTRVIPSQSPGDEGLVNDLPGASSGHMPTGKAGASSPEIEDEGSFSKQVHVASPYFLENIGFNYGYAKPRLFDIQPVAENNRNANTLVPEKAKKDLQDRKLTFYLQAMPTFTYNRVETNQEDDQLVSAVEKIPAISTERMGMRLEAGLLYPLGDKFSVFAGILYFQRSQEIRYTLQQVDSMNVETVGDRINFLPEYSEEQNTYSHQLRNLGLQLGTTYNIPSNKVLSSIGAGVELHKSLRGPADDLFEQPDLYLFYNVFYRVEYPKDKRFRFLAQPTFNYSLNLNKNLNTPFYIKPYGFGLNFGFTFKL